MSNALQRTRAIISATNRFLYESKQVSETIKKEEEEDFTLVLTTAIGIRNLQPYETSCKEMYADLKLSK